MWWSMDILFIVCYWRVSNWTDLNMNKKPCIWLFTVFYWQLRWRISATFSGDLFKQCFNIWYGGFSGRVHANGSLSRRCPSCQYFMDIVVVCYYVLLSCLNTRFQVKRVPSGLCVMTLRLATALPVVLIGASACGMWVFLERCGLFEVFEFIIIYKCVAYVSFYFVWQESARSRLVAQMKDGPQSKCKAVVYCPSSRYVNF